MIPRSETRNAEEEGTLTRGALTLKAKDREIIWKREPAVELTPNRQGYCSNICSGETVTGCAGQLGLGKGGRSAPQQDCGPLKSQ